MFNQGSSVYQFIAIIFLIILSIASLTVSLNQENINFYDFSLNFGTEILGILITVAVIQHLFDQQKKKEECTKIAWRVIHDLDHAVWVWLGGLRQFDESELIALLSQVDSKDDLPPFTEALFLRLGSRVENTLRESQSTVKVNGDLVAALKNLKHLSTLRNETDENHNLKIQQSCIFAIERLSKVLKLSPDAQIYSDLIKDSSSKSQNKRHWGKD